ncbi:juvenile hormone acid O-methyltransferase isoform X2 [Halyomorpha halys]|uniref:juvenile hormone acid O-methyltransferase isoform X2 n=1 Tax=Halyomorpha halys TaxID=286706 RepID=UPI0006D50244
MDLVENFVNNNNVTGKDTLEILEAHRKSFRWSKEERVLDIGCGPGDATANVILPSLPEGSVLVGCDISDGMLETCKRHVVNGRLTFKKLDIQQKWLNNGWENESFTKIFSFYCLHWVTDHRQAMQNVYTLLKPEGEILLAFLTPQNPIYNAFEILKQSPKWNGFMKDIEWFCTTADTTSFYTDLLKSIGFEDIQCYLKTTKHRIPSWTAYIGSNLFIVNLERKFKEVLPFSERRRQ